MGQKTKPLDCRLKYWYDLNVGDIVIMAGQKRRIWKRTLDAVWLEEVEDETKARRLEQRDKELEGPAEDRQEAVSPSQEVREQG